MAKTLEELEEDLKFYTEVRDRNQKERRFRMVEGAQQNIDRTMDLINKLKRGEQNG